MAKELQALVAELEGYVRDCFARSGAEVQSVSSGYDIGRGCYYALAVGLKGGETWHERVEIAMPAPVAEAA